MIKIIDKRGTGKTGRLLLLAKEKGYAVACNNPNSMRDKAYSYGITGIEFISYHDFLNRKNFDKGCLIDDLDAFLNYMNKNVEGYTLCDE